MNKTALTFLSTERLFQAKRPKQRTLSSLDQWKIYQISCQPNSYSPAEVLSKKIKKEKKLTRKYMVNVFSPCGDSFPVLPTLDALNNPFSPSHSWPSRHAIFLPFSSQGRVLCYATLYHLPEAWSGLGMLSCSRRFLFYFFVQKD